MPWHYEDGQRDRGALGAAAVFNRANQQFPSLHLRKIFSYLLRLSRAWALAAAVKLIRGLFDKDTRDHAEDWDNPCHIGVIGKKRCPPTSPWFALPSPCAAWML